MDTTKIPDRLEYSVKVNQLIEKLDDENYMGLGTKSITRSALFLFAMALGVETKSPTELKNKYSGGLVLDKSIDGKTQASMYANFITSLKDPENELDSVASKADVYKMAEQYANTGFEIIADYVENKKPDDLVWDLFLELDKQYEDIKKPVIYSHDKNYGYFKVAENK